jgi:hypothetical protein
MSSCDQPGAPQREEKRQRYRDLVRRTHEGLEQSRRDVLAWLERLVGAAFLKHLLEDRAAAERALDDPDPNVRRCALHLLVEQGGQGGSLAQRCEAMAAGDPDPGVRRTAVGQLGSLYTGTSHPRVGALLARITRSEQEPPEVRFSAYLAIIDLCGLACSWEPNPATLTFPRDVDWAFVDSFLA